MYPYDNSTFQPIEVGAASFVSTNKNLVRAMKAFELTATTPNSTRTAGIWDGTEFVWTVSDRDTC